MKHRHQIRFAATVVAIAITSAFGVTPASAAPKVAESTFGGKGTTGGLFGGIRDIAVNQATGQIYVVDANRRIQRLDASYDFELAFGRDVIAAGKPGDLGDTFEVCTVAADCKAGVSGALGIALRPDGIALSPDGDDLYVIDGNNRITKFVIGDNGTPVDPSDDVPVFERAWGWDVVQPDGTGEVKGNERQAITFVNATGGTFRLVFADEVTASIPYDASAGAVQLALENLPNVAPGDVTVSGAPGSPWTVDFSGAYAGLDVSEISLFIDSTLFFGPNGDVRFTTPFNGAGFEICTVASQCKIGGIGYDGGHVHGESLAVGPAGDVFLANAGNAQAPVTFNSRIEQFGPDGEFKRAWGWGVDTGADQFEICTEVSLCEAAVAPAVGSGQAGQFRGQYPKNVAVDSSGVVYATNDDGNNDNPRLERFDSTKALASELLLPNPIGTATPPPGFPAGPLPSKAPGGLKIDPGNDHLYYLAHAGGAITEVDAVTDPNAPEFVDTHMEGVEANVSVTGLGYGDGADRLYVSVQQIGNQTVNRIVVVGNNGAPDPALTVEPPAAVGAHQVTLKGTVTPNGPLSITTSYRFEYRKVGAPTWNQIPTTPIDLGDGSVPVPVEQTPAELEACADYETRLFASKTFGAGTTISTPAPFKTLCVAPEVDTLAPQRGTDNEATLAANLNPNNLPTAYRFEYVTEVEFQANGYADAQLAPVPDASANGGTVRKVLEDVEGLTPDTAYRYRIVATNAQGTTEGDDVSFATNASPVGPVPQRGFEMVTPPFKSVRGAMAPGRADGHNPNGALPSLDGETMLWSSPFFPLTEDVGSPFNADQRIIRRTASGWVNETLNTLGVLPGGSSPLLLRQNSIASSGDLETQPVRISAGSGPTGLLPTEGAIPNVAYTRRTGTGTEGYTPWLSNPELQSLNNLSFEDAALLNDDGTAMVRAGTYVGLGGDDDPSDDLGLQGTAETIYLQRAAEPDDLPSAPKELVNGCTGVGSQSTQLPSRVGGGSVTDTIGRRNCQSSENSRLVSVNGAILGGSSGDGAANGAAEGPGATALSGNGNRVFFESPDPGLAPAACTTGTVANTSCPPQLFVRSHDSEGNAAVSWISRSRSVAAGGNAFGGAMIAGQRIAEMGRGVGFQGASRDGRHVYFKTNAPLVPNDPNGGVSITTGAASDNSWDLYRYELPGSIDQDPADGTLTRISGGPTGTADPSANVAGGSGAPLRFLSDDGRRAYFVTTSPIAGADGTAPGGGSTSPGGGIGNTVIRNLYLFDDSEGGGEYRFIARIPFSGPGQSNGNNANELNVCASSNSLLGYQLTSSGGDEIRQSTANCFHGSADGSHVVFFSQGRLTEDDNDEAGDIYLYDVAEDELTRISAPPAGAMPYGCNRNIISEAGKCNADFGWPPYSFGVLPGGEGDFARGWGGMRYMNVAKDTDGVVSVFFESRSQLLPADQNGDRWDVYQWRQGKLSLVSRALPGHHSYFSGNSTDGEDVFLWTSDQIDPREIDPVDYDLYDARVGGGFPYTPPPQPCDVLGLRCEGGATEPPPTAPASSASFAGAGNPRKPTCRKNQVKRRGRCVPRHRAKARGKNRSQRRAAR